MADTNTIAEILKEASNVYFRSKSLDLAQAQAKQQQTNLEIDRGLQEERFEKQVRLRILDDNKRAARKKLNDLTKDFEASNLAYKKHTGEYYKIDDANKTTSGSEVLKNLNKWTMNDYEANINKTESAIDNLQNQQRVLIGRLAEITTMQEDIAGGAGGFTGGLDPKAYDKGDFSYEEYLERTDVESKDYLEKAYRGPTPAELTKLNAAEATLNYRKGILETKTGAGVNEVNNSWRRSMYQQTQSLEGLQPLNQASLLYAAEATKDTNDQNEGILNNLENKLSRQRLNIALRADPTNMKAVEKKNGRSFIFFRAFV